MFNSNLGHLFGGSRKSRELDEIRGSWDHAQEAWRASIGRIDPDDPIGRLAIEILQESWEELDRPPSVSIAVGVGSATGDLLSAEHIGEFTPLWDAITSDVSIAVEFRQVVADRYRYASEFSRVHRVFKRRLLEAYRALYAALPDSCFRSPYEAEGSFEVPLIDLVDDPEELVRVFMAMPFEADAKQFDLFRRLRAQLGANLKAASGLPLDQDWFVQGTKFVGPSDQKGKTPAQLADMYLAHTPFRELLDTPVPFHVEEQVRFEHCHIVGGTGHGKTQLMQRLIHADLAQAQTQKRSVLVIDSQGDLINRLVRLSLFSPETRNSLADRLVLIDPADVEFPPALNLFDAHLDRLEDYRPVDRERVLNGVVEVYENFFGDLLGAELTQKQGVVFKYLARLMLVIPGATIHTLIQLMENPKPYVQYMERLEGSARFFFETEFFDPSFAQTKRQIQRRLWGVLSTPAFERMFAQPSNKLDLFQALQDGKIVLINTAKDLLKQEGSELFGRFFIGLLSQAILERSTLDPEDRTPTMVFVDEAQEYFDDTIETILNQARKYRTGITMAHQAVDQLSPRLRDVMHANTSMKCVGGTSAKDARALASELHTSTEFIESMKRRNGQSEFAVWIRNQTPRAIRMTVPLGFLERQPILSEEEYEALIEENRRRYCGTMAEVEAELRKLRPVRDFSQLADRSSRKAPERGERPAEPRPSVQEVVEPLPSEPASLEPIFPEPEEAEAVPPPEPRAPPRPRPAPVEPGKGGPQHKYLQQLVRGLATDRGFRAVIEEAVEGGQVDVGLHRGELSIACEISVTSTPDYEAQNLAKCLRVGFTRVWAIAPDAKRKKAIQARAKERLGADAEKVEFLTADEAAFLLEQLAEPEPEETVVRGYRVKSSRKVVSPEEAAARRASIARILSQSR